MKRIEIEIEGGGWWLLIREAGEEGSQVTGDGGSPAISSCRLVGH
jgi:hypothetical protein